MISSASDDRGPGQPDGPVTEISVTEIEIFPYEHSSPVTGTKLLKNSFTLTTLNIAAKMA